MFHLLHQYIFVLRNIMKNTVSIEISERLDRIFDFILSQKSTYKFNLSNLPDLNNYTTNILDSEFFREIFNDLNKKTKNCIYWFELQNEQECTDLISILNINREFLRENFRVVPPKNKNQNSKVLYLGIRRGGIRKKDNLTNISGRIVQHLGYYVKGSTQGLQLVHWCKGVDMHINLNVVELDNLPNDYLNVAEKILSYHLKPMCGKH